MRRGVINASVFAFTMANVEAMIVVYLRRLYYPEGFTFPLVLVDNRTLLLELTREACTLAMLVAFGVAAGSTSVGKLAFFFVHLRRLGHILLHLAQNLSQLARFPVHLGSALPHSSPVDWSGFGTD